MCRYYCVRNVNSSGAQAIVQSGLLSNGDDQPKKGQKKLTVMFQQIFC